MDCLSFSFMANLQGMKNIVLLKEFHIKNFIG